MDSTTATNSNLRVPNKSISAQWLGQGDGKDLSGPTVSPGPDGIVDFHLRVNNISAGATFQSLLLTANPGTPSAIAWEANLNTYYQWPDNTPRPSISAARYFETSTPGTVDFYANPVTNQNGGSKLTSGSPLSLRVTYIDEDRLGKTDTMLVSAGVTASNVNPSQAAPAPTVDAFATFSAHSTPQDSASLGGRSHIVIDSLPEGRTKANIRQAILSDPAGGLWVYGRGGDLPYTGAHDFYADSFDGTGNAVGLSLDYDPSAGPYGTFSFAPYRDERDTTLTLRLVFDDSPGNATQAVSRVPGVASNVDWAGASRGQTAQDAYSAQQLYGYVDTSFAADSSHQVANIHLKAPTGQSATFVMDKPLILAYPVKITADPGVTLRFAPNTNSVSMWGDTNVKAAVVIKASNTSLEGFTIDFQDNTALWPGYHSKSESDPKDSVIRILSTTPERIVGVSITNMTLKSPQSQHNTDIDERAVNLITSSNKNNSGHVEGNTLLGGSIALNGGPWTILGNTYLGARSNTDVKQIFDFSSEHDVKIIGNAFYAQETNVNIHRLYHAGQSSFGRGYNDILQNNTVYPGVGQIDGADAAELILTEQYLPMFEGSIGSTTLSPDGYALKIPGLMGLPPTTGDVVAILSGPHAGEYRLIAQAIDLNEYYLDSPLPSTSSGSYDIAIHRGWVKDLYDGNTIDLHTATGGNVGLDLAGNQFGTTITNNMFYGRVAGNTTSGGIRVAADPTNIAVDGGAGEVNPPPWGFSHNPVFGLMISGNTLCDAPLTLFVNHQAEIRANNGRTYFSGVIENNAFVRTTGTEPKFQVGVEANPSPSSEKAEPDYTQSHFPWLDPSEIVLTIRDNWGVGPTGGAAHYRIIAAKTDPGGIVNDTTYTLPTQPTVAPQLTATSSTTAPEIDLLWTRVGGATGYIIERRVSGSSTWSAFDPIGANVTSYADRSVAASTTYEYRIHANSSGGPSPASTATATASGAGNPAITVASLGQDGRDFVGTTALAGADGYQDIHLSIAGLVPSKSVASIYVHPLNGGEYHYFADNHYDGVARAYLVRANGAAGADLYLAPYQNEAGRPFYISIYYSDASLIEGWSTPVYADYNLSLPTLKYLGQDGSDLTGPGKQPDGLQDMHLRLNGIQSAKMITFLDIVGLPFDSNDAHRWQYYSDPNAPSSSQPLKIVPVMGDPRSYDLYLNAWQSEDGTRQLAVTKINFSDGVSIGNPIDPSTFIKTGDTVSANQSLRAGAIRGDYDNDGKADPAEFNTSTGTWYIQKTKLGGQGFAPVQFGAGTDVPIQGDFDGDGLADFAVYRPSNATWYILRSRDGGEVVQFGQPGVDQPVVADYDGDGKADLAVFRPTTATWYIIQSSAGAKVVQFGQPGVDQPVVADYDGDGKADLAVFRPTTATWYIIQSSAGGRTTQFGQANVDKTIPADYDGDRKADLAVFRPTTDQWIILYSGGGSNVVQFGQVNVDKPVPTDYDGDGKADLAVFRPTTDQWIILYSGGGSKITQFGQLSGDIPILAPFAFQASASSNGGSGGSNSAMMSAGDLGELDDAESWPIDSPPPTDEHTELDETIAYSELPVPNNIVTYIGNNISEVNQDSGDDDDLLYLGF